MKSLAIWLDKPLQTTPIELHLNVWKLPKKIFLKNEFKRVIDIGMKVNLPDNTSEMQINLFYPAAITNYDIEDLITRLINNVESKLMSTLFNENLSLHIDSNSDFSIVKDNNGNIDYDFTTYKVKSNKITVEHRYGGSIIKIKINKIPPTTKKIYIRFRIKKDYTNVFYQKTNQFNSWLLSSYSAPELFDIRVNEVRELDNDLLEEIEEKSELATYSKINLFYICCVKDEYGFSHVPFNSSRLFEREKWNHYIDLVKIRKLPILAYHFKKESKKENEPIKDFNVMVQTKYEKNNTITILKYVIMLFAITLLFNLISNYIWELIRKQ